MSYVGAANLRLGVPKIWKIQTSHFLRATRRFGGVRGRQPVTLHGDVVSLIVALEVDCLILLQVHVQPLCILNWKIRQRDS